MTDPTPTRAEVEALVAHNKALIDRNVALRERAEAADSLITELRHRYAAGQVALTEARASAALAWEAGRDAAAEAGGNYMSDDADEALLGMWREDIRTLTPPADLSAALTARLDAEWNAAIEAADRAAIDRQGRRAMGDGHGNSCYDIGVSDAASAIRALRRAAPTEDQ